MAKISKYPEWIAALPPEAEFIIAYNGKNYKTHQSTIINSGNDGDGGGTTGGTGAGDEITDFIYDITPLPDGINTIFNLRFAYFPLSCKVYLGGNRQTRNQTLGVDDYDYEEAGENQIRFTNPPPEGINIVVDYKPLTNDSNNCATWADEDDTSVVDEDDTSIMVDDCTGEDCETLTDSDNIDITDFDGESICTG